jgi:CRP/FNR family transcriptional regulator, cyclic AMP receptor protein
VALRLAERLRRATLQRAVLALPSSFQRVCAQLRLLTEPQSGGAIVIPLPPTHQEIAIMVNTSRETVTRTLQFLQGLQIVVRAGTQLVVEKPAALKDAADGKLAPPKAGPG